jgi:hypothetical protein
MSYICPIEGCGKVIQNKGAMGMHIRMIHLRPRDEAKKLANMAELAPPEADQPADQEEPTAGQKAAEGQPADMKESGVKTMDDFDPMTKAKFVYDFTRGMNPEEKAVFGASVGLPMKTEAVALEEESGESPGVIKGKTELPGYKYLETLDISVKQ